MSFGTSPLELLAADAMLQGSIYCNSAVYPAKWLTGQASALGSGLTIPQVLQINGDSDFICQMINGIAWSAAATITPDPNIEALIEIASGRMWFNQSANFRTIFGGWHGTSPAPGTLPMPRLIPAQSTVTITLTEQQSVSWNRVEVELIGFNVYYQSATRSEVFHVL
jgi:hypothetical protein